MAISKHKKKNRKMKKTVRMAFAAVCMLTAIIIALVPVPDIKADSTAYAYPVSTNSIPAIADESITTDYNLSGTTQGSSYTIRQLGSVYQYDRQFDYYKAAEDNTKAIICGYNSTYNADSVTVPSIITTGYVTVSEDELQEAMEAPNPISYTLSGLNSLNAWFFQKYDSGNYNTYISQYTIWNDWNNGDKSTAEPTKPADLTKTVDSLSDDQQLSYYCDIKVTDNQAKDYKLTKVLNGADNTWIYIPKGGTSTPNLNDDQGFLMNDSVIPVIAIGDRAFAGTQNVHTLVIDDVIKYIGDEAFMDTWVQTVDFGNASSIGNRAFKGCNHLVSVSFSSATTTIGAEAFYGTYLTSLTFPSSLKTIGEGAFANCVKLNSVDMSGITTADSTIKRYAFFNDYAINTLNMTGSSISYIGDAAFAATSGITGTLKEFTFPTNISEAADLGNYTLAGRTNLTSVIMPANYGLMTSVTLPNGTFENCVNLAKVVFPDNKNGSCGYASYEKSSIQDAEGNSKDVATIFSKITNKDFCVYGPELNIAAGKASPRTSTWIAYTAVSPTVPYIFTDSKGVTYIEISDGTYLLTANQKGELVTCTELTPGTSLVDINIPAVVGGYKITTIVDGCFDTIKPRIKTLTIEDDSVTSIADGVFEGCTNLTEVHIGNSVTSIGANAFKDCNSLTDVYFNTPSSYTGFKMGTAAFETGSDELTFHGDIVEGYAPFDWAMDYTINTQGTKSVCYKSNAPSNLTVISYKQKDSTSGNRIPTLVDYPLYENVDKDNQDYEKKQVKAYREKYSLSANDLQAFENWLTETSTVSNNAVYSDGYDGYSIIRKYEEQSGTTDLSTLKEYQILTSMEQAIISNTQNITIPAGVDSIDAKDFFTQTYSNAGNITSYVLDTFLQYDLLSDKFNEQKKQIIYKADTSDTTYANTVHGGLFSGEFSEDLANTVQKITKGNDRLTSITLTGVSTLPDYAFDSCESLASVDLGTCTDVGTAPFTGCDKLTAVICKSPYTFQNGILYKTNSDGTYTIVECLPARGNLIKPKTITIDSDPLLAKVSAIEDGAFQNCDYITKVDLSAATTLKKIPENCFNACDNLNDVYLPESVNEILDDAFTECPTGLSVEIQGTEVHITYDAFTHKQGIIRTYKDSAAYSYATLYDIDVEILGTKYIVSFVDYDGTVIGTDQKVESGKDAVPPTPDPTRVGYTFAGWNKSYKNITANTIIMATYKATGQLIVTFLDYNGNVLSKVAVDAGASATPPANPSRTGYTFTGWSGAYTNVTEDKTLVAQYTSNSSSNGGTSSGSSSSDDDDDNNSSAKNSSYYPVTVVNGTGSGSYEKGRLVYINAFASPTGKHFVKWTSSSNGVGFASATSRNTNFTMPSNAVTVTANFADGPETASSNNTVTPTSTVSGNKSTGGGSGSSSGTNSNSTGTKAGGTVVSITKPGFSDTDKASAVVHGSTDNYIIKITEDADAQAQIEAALLADTDTLENIKYFPMDISLYDSTGTNKITDTTGITIDITLPLPDELREYAGNNKVAGVVNGTLDKLTPTFNSIDGVPCVTFTASHFSPYTIYVDTANLSDGSIDSSPKTGDPIHPKWFLVIGLASVSILLFMKKDRKRTIKIS